MNTSICIKTNNDIILNYLLTNLDYISDISFSKKSFKMHECVIIHSLTNNIYAFYESISTLLTKTIVNFFEKKLILRFLNINYFYFSNKELKDINYLTNSIINSDECAKTFKIDRNNSLKNCIIEYFKDNKSMILEGFVNFRIKSYINILEEYITIAVNEYIIQKEYTRLIELLKLYINTQESKISYVHLIYLEKKAFLVDEHKNLINTKNIELELKYLSDISFCEKDYLLNTLLTLLPQKIYLHLIGKEDEFINTLKQIFQKKMSVCTNCDICKLYKIKSQKNF